MADWDPELYNRFRRYRAEPVEAIFARLALGPDERIVDLGCGSGENTVELARRSRHGFATGIDSSPAMIERAGKLRDGLDPALGARLAFTLGDFRDLDAERKYTVVFSNAAIQWVRDHRSVFAACRRALRPGGTLAVQMSANEEETAQATIVALAGEEPWRALVGEIRTPSRTVGAPGAYAEMLREIGFDAIDCDYHTFRHPMESPTEIVVWCRGTALRPFLERLPSARQEIFVDLLIRRLEREYATSGPLMFNFRRLFI
ncbi:MAG: methyltransferase domain-containing protein, partial [Candidatus Binataceae bacterium]